jgi:hypothetical protein
MLVILHPMSADSTMLATISAALMQTGHGWRIDIGRDRAPKANRNSKISETLRNFGGFKLPLRPRE